MQIHRSHDRKITKKERERRSFLGEDDAYIVLHCLNGTGEEIRRVGEVYHIERHTPREKERVIAVIEAIRRLDQLMKGHKDHPVWRREEVSNRDFVDLVPEAGDAIGALNKKLLKYRYCSFFTADRTFARRWSFSWIFAGRGIVPVETQAVHAVVNLADMGMLDRLQRCACGLWYFARFSHQRFCSDACRTGFWENSEERKEQKRQRARENYQYKKTRPNRTRKRR